MVPCKITAKEVSFEWSHHGISSTDSKVRAALCYTNTNKIPGELSHENMISSHVKITCYSHL